MASLSINKKARDAIQRSLSTSDFTQKRNLLSTAVFALQPDRESKMRPATDFSKLIDDLLLAPPERLETAVCEAAERVWQ